MIVDCMAPLLQPQKPLAADNGTLYHSSEDMKLYRYAPERSCVVSCQNLH